MPLYPPPIPHDLTWAWTLAAVVGSQGLTAWAMTRLIFNFIFRIRRNHRGWGWASREGGGWLLFSLKSKVATQGVACGWASHHGSGPRNWCAMLLDVCDRHFPSAAPEHCNISFHSRSALVEQIPYARCFQCKKNKGGGTTDLTLFQTCHAFLHCHEFHFLEALEDCCLVSGLYP
jgi:hypothetical protein